MPPYLLLADIVCKQEGMLKNIKLLDQFLVPSNPGLKSYAFFQAIREVEISYI